RCAHPFCVVSRPCGGATDPDARPHPPGALPPRLPLALLLGAHRAPHLPAPPITGGYVADDAELVRGLAVLGGLPKVLLERPDWLAALLPVVRGDLMLCDGAGDVDRTPLPVPVHAFAGGEDRLVTVPEVREWSRYSTRESEILVVPGGHFFIREQETLFLDQLRDVLLRYEAEALYDESVLAV
ncbi:thioesterase II family protein, partial [Streptomyces sp. NPDC002920]